MFVAAVTGTNGKTSTVEFTRQFLQGAGIRACSYGTLGLTDTSGCSQPARMGLGKTAAQRFVRSLETKGFDAIALEAYSSPLEAGLLDCLSPDAAAFTGFGHDHLDFHGSLQAYFAAKRRLFAEILPSGQVAVLNLNTPQGKALEELCKKRGVEVLTVGTFPGADLRLIALEVVGHISRAEVSILGHRYQCDLPLIGKFMVTNALCAAGLSLAAGLHPQQIEETLPYLKSPAGRVQWIIQHNGAHVLIDYAHTPDALSALLSELKKRTARRLILVWGCGGNRDQTKRSKMGEIASRLADVVIVTDDNPRCEDPATIRQQILRSCPKAQEIPGREQAIGKALASVSEGDILIIAGKGHETHQEIGRKKIPYSDHAAILKVIGEN